VFANRVLRRIFGPKRKEVVGRVEKTAHDLYTLPNIIRVIKFRGQCFGWKA
jgi:hypothetical protein